MAGAINGRNLRPDLTRRELAGRDLGECCICNGREGVHHLVDLDARCPIIGRGWGCRVCGLETHGAVAVLCRPCLDLYERGAAALRFACRGIPWVDGRVPFYSLTGTWRHDLAKHVSPSGGFLDGVG